MIVPPEQLDLDLFPPRRSPLAGETLTVSERMIVAPVVGIFRPNEVVEGPGTSCPVTSPFDGTVMGMLAHPGERLRSGQPIAWLRVA